MAVELGEGCGSSSHARRPLPACTLEISEVLGAGKVRELAAESENLLVRLCPVQRRSTIGPEQRILLRGMLGVRVRLWMVRRLRMLGVLRILGMLLRVWMVLGLLIRALLPLKRGPRHVAGAICQIAVDGRRRLILPAKGAALLDLLD
jgi:hypothetical protein